MPNQDFIQIAQKLRRLEQIMGGLAADAEYKAVLFEESGLANTAEQRRISPSEDRGRDPMNRETMGRLLLKLRNSRHDHLEPELFSNASWDILLTLYVDGDAGRKPLPIKAICQDAKIPVATGERWLNLLFEQGLIRRESPTQQDGLIMLSQPGVASMEHYIDSAGAAIYALFVEMRLGAEMEGDLVA
ncbi:hypothetical protein [Croceicoccus sp. BE223]|uniref:hypothetical protein n=1 Tax=Croceicoccus sp. BE223 TaxID=2817716 RepID=UPI00285A20DA|nr:hypothetical protein [Croceicoccus sp. BE223]MDR7103017.1 hypothetical protein [Croceicoccus sp. BE223]